MHAPHPGCCQHAFRSEQAQRIHAAHQNLQRTAAVPQWRWQIDEHHTARWHTLDKHRCSRPVDEDFESTRRDCARGTQFHRNARRPSLCRWFGTDETDAQPAQIRPRMQIRQRAQRCCKQRDQMRGTIRLRLRRIPHARHDGQQRQRVPVPAHSNFHDITAQEFLRSTAAPVRDRSCRRRHVRDDAP